MTEGLWISLVGLLAVPISVFITWFVNRKKHVADIYTAISASSQNAVETMQIAMDTLNVELKHAHTKIDALIDENKKMHYELGQLRQQNMLLLQENHVLHRKIDELTQMVADTGEHPILIVDDVLPS